jgi:ribosome maturation factor RimP
LVDTNAIERLIEPSLDAMGYRIVRVVLTSSRGATLQVMVERLDDMPMSLDDCTLISHSVSALLDVADPIAGAYRLEISSPGVDRPLLTPADYERFRGREAKIELTEPWRGRRRFRGRLLGVADGTVGLVTAAGEEHLPLTAVARANLVFAEVPAATVRPGTRQGRAGRMPPKGNRHPSAELHRPSAGRRLGADVRKH